jgi:hypothetical protein
MLAAAVLNDLGHASFNEVGHASFAHAMLTILTTAVLMKWELQKFGMHNVC